MADAAANPGLRLQVRAKLLQCGVPADQVDPIVDLAFFATNQAMDSLARVTSTAPSQPASKTAFEIALQLTAALATDAAQALQEAGRAAGHPLHQFEVKGPYDG